jgi:hypothetical protein
MVRGCLPSVVLYVLMISSGPVWAQDADTQPEPVRQTRWEGGLGVLAAAAVGEFGNNVDSAAGVSGNVGRRLGESVASVGLEVAYYWYGHESRLEPFSPSIPDAGYKVDTDNNILLVHARLRAQAPSGRLRPYAEGLVGLRDIYTRTSVHTEGLDELPGSPAVTRRVNLRDIGLSYGVGSGIMVGFGSPLKRAMLVISLRYVAGPEGDYLTEGSIRREGGEAILDIKRSRTDMVTLFIGVAWPARR